MQISLYYVSKSMYTNIFIYPLTCQPLSLIFQLDIAMLAIFIFHLTLAMLAIFIFHLTFAMLAIFIFHLTLAMLAISSFT